MHAGFHKTATTTVQSTLHTNRRILSRHIRLFLKPDFESLTEAARAFSIDPSPDNLSEVIRTSAIFFDTIDPEDHRPILMSSEDLCGHMPGRLGLDRYDAASLVLSQLVEAARLRFGAETEITIFLSTRGRADWLRSTWWQNLRSTRLTLALDDYSRQISSAADLDVVLDDIAETVAPSRVASCALEVSSQAQWGPITPILDLLGIPELARNKLQLLPPENAQPDLGLEDTFLALNRSGLKDRYVQEAKRTLRQMANKQSKDG